MEVIGGILVAAFVLFIGSKAGFVTIRFHKREDAPSSGSGGTTTKKTATKHK